MILPGGSGLGPDTVAPWTIQLVGEFLEDCELEIRRTTHTRVKRTPRRFDWRSDKFGTGRDETLGNFPSVSHFKRLLPRLAPKQVSGQTTLGRTRNYPYAASEGVRRSRGGRALELGQELL